MLLSCARAAVIPLSPNKCRNLGAEGAWAKIIGGVPGEPVAHRAAQVTVDVFKRQATAAAARFIRECSAQELGGLGSAMGDAPATAGTVERPDVAGGSGWLAGRLLMPCEIHSVFSYLRGEWWWPAHTPWRSRLARAASAQEPFHDSD
jgi:hypothetical protein